MLHDIVQDIVLVATLIFLVSIFVNRSSTRGYYQGQLRALACTAVEYTPSSQSPTVRDLREQYQCPPAGKPPMRQSNRSAFGLASPDVRTSTPTPAATSVSPTGGRTSSQPAAGNGRDRHRSTPAARPSSPATRTPHANPGRGATPTRSHTPTRTPSRTPSPTPRSTPLVPGLVCPVLNTPLLCSETP